MPGRLPRRAGGALFSAILCKTALMAGIRILHNGGVGVPVRLYVRVCEWPRLQRLSFTPQSEYF